MYNHFLVWQLLSLAVNTANLSDCNILFKTGELLLDSSDEQFKADGLIEMDGIELCLLETSGTCGLSDNCRFGKDHVKGSFGTLIFLRKILRTFYFATESTLHELMVLFGHARGKRIHLCSLEMPAQDVQVLEHLSYADIPTDASQIDKIIDLGNFVWKLIDCLKRSCDTINKMKEEHRDYLLMLRLTTSNLATFCQKWNAEASKGKRLWHNSSKTCG
ncbi:hypothetical protein EDC96DRAFT_544047 [Choanephora cucurbitarum]|nr:hypothetical protein EDC96DRAFT_544047 [Choanephora cucurbitarum]